MWLLMRPSLILYPYMLRNWLLLKRRGSDLFVRGLNYDLQVFSVYMTSAGKSFNEVTDYVKKVEGVRRHGQDKVLSNRSMKSGNF